MDNVVLLVRVSTDKQDYQRQINELNDYCGRAGWNVTEVFANKISGAKQIEEREDILTLLKYVSEHDVKRVVCLEISRLTILTGKRCSYTAISKSEDSEAGHIAGKSDNPAADFQFDSSFFSGKKVILIDDVMTRGRTLEGTARRLKEMGATEVVGLVAGITINPDWTGSETRNVERL